MPVEVSMYSTLAIAMIIAIVYEMISAAIAARRGHDRSKQSD